MSFWQSMVENIYDKIHVIPFDPVKKKNWLDDTLL